MELFDIPYFSDGGKVAFWGAAATNPDGKKERKIIKIFAENDGHTFDNEYQKNFLSLNFLQWGT
jgi:hypothetical protein